MQIRSWDHGKGPFDPGRYTMYQPDHDRPTLGDERLNLVKSAIAAAVKILKTVVSPK